MKTVFIVAGPNGAGKTSFALEYHPNEASCLTFINADLIVTQQRKDTTSKGPLGSDSASALEALRRAAVIARRRAIETSGYVTVFRDGKIVRDTTVEPPDRPSEHS